MLNPIRILVFSDLHGHGMRQAASLIDTHEPDWVVLCGDILPDFPRISGRESRLGAQRDFWKVYRSDFIREFAWTTLLCGNHEIEGFSDPELRRVPPEVRDHVVCLEGVPAEFGAWGWSREWEEDELEAELRTQEATVPEPWIYLSHVPPFGLLDRNAAGVHIGHRPLAQHLEARNWPSAMVLCGHAHESFGSLVHGKTLVVNAACGYALIEWSSDRAKLIRMERLRMAATSEIGSDGS